jgi:anti-anti-sigma factor
VNEAMTTTPGVLRLHGEIDFFTEDEFRAEAERLLDTEGITALVVDLGQVTVMDSSGLSLLVDLLRLCRDIDLPMSLRDVPDRIVQLLDMTGLDQVITVE